MREKVIDESAMVFTLTVVLMISLILVSIGGVFWLVWMMLTEFIQLNSMASGFRV